MKVVCFLQLDTLKVILVKHCLKLWQRRFAHDFKAIPLNFHCTSWKIAEWSVFCVSRIIAYFKPWNSNHWASEPVLWYLQEPFLHTQEAHVAFITEWAPVVTRARRCMIMHSAQIALSQQLHSILTHFQSSSNVHSSWQNCFKNSGSLPCHTYISSLIIQRHQFLILYCKIHLLFLMVLIIYWLSPNPIWAIVPGHEPRNVSRLAFLYIVSSCSPNGNISVDAAGSAALAGLGTGTKKLQPEEQKEFSFGELLFFKDKLRRIHSVSCLPLAFLKYWLQKVFCFLWAMMRNQSYPNTDTGLMPLHSISAYSANLELQDWYTVTGQRGRFTWTVLRAVLPQRAVDLSQIQCISKFLKNHFNWLLSPWRDSLV